MSGYDSHLPPWGDVFTRDGWAWNDEETLAYDGGSGYVTVTVMQKPGRPVAYWWEVGYRTSGNRYDPPEWISVHDGWESTIEAACEAVEWIVAVEEAEVAKAEAEIEAAMIAEAHDA